MHKQKNTVNVDLLDCISIIIIIYKPLGNPFTTTDCGQELTHCIKFASRRLHKWCVLEIPLPTLMKAKLLSKYYFTKHAIRWSCLASVWYSICHSNGFLCKLEFIEFYATTKRCGFLPSSCFRRHLDILACNWSGKTLTLSCRNKNALA